MSEVELQKCKALQLHGLVDCLKDPAVAAAVAAAGAGSSA